MKFQISTTNNGYVVTETKGVAGKGDIVVGRSVYTDKKGLMEYLQKAIPAPSLFDKEFTANV